MSETTVTATQATSFYDLHVRANPDGTWFGAYQTRTITTIAGQVISDTPSDQMGINGADPAAVATLNGILGTALTQALASNAGLTASLAAAEQALSDAQQALAAANTALTAAEAEIARLTAPADPPAS